MAYRLSLLDGACCHSADGNAPLVLIVVNVGDQQLQGRIRDNCRRVDLHMTTTAARSSSNTNCDSRFGHEEAEAASVYQGHWQV